MKVTPLFLTVFAILLIAGCTSQNKYASLSFQEVCRQTGGMWMTMQPTKDFIPTGQPACAGCMQPNGDHICEKETYLSALKK